jgi:phospholipid N-methyltransferase
LSKPPKPPNNFKSPENYNDPAAFWRSIGKEYYTLLDLDGPVYQLQELSFSNLLDEIDIKPENIVEVGAGFGRMTKRVFQKFDSSIRSYLAIDCSQDQLNLMFSKYLPPEYQTRVYPGIADILSEEFDRRMRQLYLNSVDLIVASEFLMHVPPFDIKRIMNLLISLLKPGHDGYMINVDWNVQDFQPKDSVECFHYDYARLYYMNERIRHVTIKPLPEIAQSIFLAW